MGLKWSLYGDSLYKKESVGRLIQHQRCGVSGLGFHEPGDMILLTGKSEVIRSTSAGNGFIQVQLAYVWLAIKKGCLEYFRLRTDFQRRKEALS